MPNHDADRPTATSGKKPDNATGEVKPIPQVDQPTPDSAPTGGAITPIHAPAGNANEVTVLDVSDYQPPRIPSKTWREPISVIWVVLGYVPPNVIQVAFCLGALKNLRHQGVAFFCLAASCLRPRALMAGRSSERLPTKSGLVLPIAQVNPASSGVAVPSVSCPTMM